MALAAKKANLGCMRLIKTVLYLINSTVSGNSLALMIKKTLLISTLLALLVLLALLTAPRLLMENDHVLNSIIEPVNGAKNQYPIIIHHGILPFFTLHKFARSLRQKGYSAYSTQVSAAHTPEFRGRELAEQIDIVMNSLNVDKVNIIAHSLGGIDARYIISSLGYGGKVASLTTFSSPHRGASIAQLFYERVPSLVFKMLDVYFSIALDGSAWGRVDTQACMSALVPEHMQLTFNRNNRNDDQVFYQSWTGVAGLGTNMPYDPINILYGPYIYRHEGLNDGVVSVYSSKWGEFHDPILVGHAAQIGRTSVFSPEWDYDPHLFYESMAQSLVSKGF